MNERRAYTMRARAASVEETRRRILDATFALTSDRLMSEVGLDQVAHVAGVSVQTVLRQFGSRAALLEATIEHAARIVDAERRATPADVDGALGVLLAHYEARGDAVVLLLAQEGTDPLVADVVRRGRQKHRTWVAQVFSEVIDRTDPAEHEATLDLLVVATDVYTWKLLRRDRGLGRAETAERMRRLVAAVAHLEEG